MSQIERTSKDIGKEERDQLLKQFHASGLRYDEFAREHNINVQTFKNLVWHSSRTGKLKRYCPVERKKIVESFLSAEMQIGDFAKTWGVSTSTLSAWVKRYQEFGSDGLMNKKPGEKDKRFGVKTALSVRNEIIKIKKKEPKFGLKKIKQWVYRFQGIKVSTGTVRKTVVAEGLELARVKKKVRRSSDKVRRFERAKPMQLWQSDITQFTVGQHSMKVYLTIFMDDHSRYIVGWRLQSRQTAELVIDALRDAMLKYGKPEEVLTDQGRQYFAWRGKSDLEKLLEKENIKHVVSRAHHPQTLGKCERFWETVSNEFWTRVRPFDLDEARERLKYFIDHYNYQRPHQGLDGQVPADRFFGVADEIRSVIEKTVTENSIRIAVGELPRPPAFLIGQVGDQRIAFHGTSGAFYLSKENINGEVYGNETTRESSAKNKEELSAQDNTSEATQSIASDPDQAAMVESQSRRSFTSPEENCNTATILAGSDDKVRGSNGIGIKADQIMAIEYASHIGDECGVINNSEKNEDGIYDR